MKYKIYLLIASMFFIGGFTGLILPSIATAAALQGHIKNANGKCLTNKKGQIKNNNPVQLDECKDQASQQWQLPGDGTIRMQALCLTVKDASKQSETLVQLYTCNNGAHQQWTIKDNGNIVNTASELCLDNRFNRIDNGNPIQIYYCNGTTAQQWSVPEAAVTPIDEAFERPFHKDSPWKIPIPDNVQLDQHNTTIVNELTKAGSPAAALVHEFAIPVYNANLATSTKQVTCTQPWGTCPFAGKDIPLSADMKPHKGSDEAMVVVDTLTRQTAEFWQFKWNDGQPTASWGAMLTIDGNGVGGSSVGAGVSRLAGLVRLSDIERKAIEHALVFSTSLCRSDTYRFPATKTDGKAGYGSETIEEGTRLQLDPSINLDTIPDITPIEKMIGKALQRYGAYAIDCGGAKMAVSFELDTKNSDVVSPAYKNAGIRWDYDNMPHIPWQKLRVLKSWDGQ